VDDYVDAGNGASLDITDAITVEAWVKPMQDTIGIYRGVVTKQDAATYSGYLLAISDNGFWFRIYDTGGSNPVAYADSTYNIGSWYHVVAKRGNNKVYFYINGIEQASKPDSLYSIKSNTQTLKIGRYWTDISNFYFNGLIDDVRIYNRALSDAEIQAIYNATK